MLQRSTDTLPRVARELDVLDAFSAELDVPNLIEKLRHALVGEGRLIPGPFGAKPMVYADYVASGRALDFLENFVVREILPFYANSHTEGSHCGAFITQTRKRARQIIADALCATDEHAVMFAGPGATTAINRLTHLLDIQQLANEGNQPLVLVGPYEHHSNILPWRETGAEVIEVPEAADGGIDLVALEHALGRGAGGRLVIGAFSACSNVTGITTDVQAITRILKKNGALAVWDYAGGAPYLPIDMAAGTDAALDAVFLSPHKFIGGPGASGILCVRKHIVTAHRPSQPGGGTVSYVSPWDHDYVDDLAEREEGGTPNVVGDIRTALAFLVKEAVGTDFIDARDKDLTRRALARLSKVEGIEILGHLSAHRLPFLSFVVKDLNGDGYVHHNLATRVLSDYFGIQARGGCACAGPYGHRLLGVDFEQSNHFRSVIRAGDAAEKPGWVRLNLCYLLDDAHIDFIIDSVAELPKIVAMHGADYALNTANAQFVHCCCAE